MRRRAIWLMLAMLLALVIPLGVAAQDPPAPVARYLFRTAGVPLAGPVELVQVVADFAPGAWSPLHNHAGQVATTVIAGALTLRAEGTETLYRPGETWVEVPGGRVHQAGNAGAAPAAAMGTYLVPQGAPLSTPHPGGPGPAPPGPTARHQFRTAAALPAGPYELAHTVLEFAPGAQTPPHTHPGQVFVSVLEGELTFASQGATKVYRAGESFVEQPGVAGQAANRGGVPAAAMVTYLVPRGAPLSTPAPGMPGLPATGAGNARRPAAALWLVALGGAGLVVVDRLLRRRATARRG